MHCQQLFNRKLKAFRHLSGKGLRRWVVGFDGRTLSCVARSTARRKKRKSLYKSPRQSQLTDIRYFSAFHLNFSSRQFCDFAPQLYFEASYTCDFRHSEIEISIKILRGGGEGGTWASDCGISNLKWKPKATKALSSASTCAEMSAASIRWSRTYNSHHSHLKPQPNYLMWNLCYVVVVILKLLWVHWWIAMIQFYQLCWLSHLFNPQKWSKIHDLWSKTSPTITVLWDA